MNDQKKDNPDPERPHRKGTAHNNNRPIKCLLMTWKILTAQIRMEIYYLLISHGVLPEEQKGCRKVTKGTVDLLYIDHILKGGKTRKNVIMAWIDNKKAYNMVTQS